MRYWGLRAASVPGDAIGSNRTMKVKKA